MINVYFAYTRLLVRKNHQIIIRTNCMSDAFVNQVTLDCLLNKELYNSQVRGKRAKQLNKEEQRFYRKRTLNLFKEMINKNSPENLFPDVKYAYDNFVNAAVNYFKTIDNSDIIQAEYAGLDSPADKTDPMQVADCSANLASSIDADLCMMRSIKIETPTLDKYVIRTKTKKKSEILLPQQKDINLHNPELKTKGLKKE
jgi:hypothetical protein